MKTLKAIILAAACCGLGVAGGFYAGKKRSMSEKLELFYMHQISEGRAATYWQFLQAFDSGNASNAQLRMSGLKALRLYLWDVDWLRSNAHEHNLILNQQSYDRYKTYLATNPIPRPVKTNSN